MDSYCGVLVDFEYHTDKYTVRFDIGSMAVYRRVIYSLPSNHLGYKAQYSCSNNDSCALEFAQRKVLELPPARTIHRR